MFKMKTKIHLGRIFLSLCLPFIGGCTIVQGQIIPNDLESTYTWVKTHEAREMRIIKTDRETVKRLCPQNSNPLACAVWYHDVSLGCEVYTWLEKMPQSVHFHEKKHCDGYSHKEN